MNEGGPDGGGEEVASELVEPKIAPPEIEYAADTLNGEPFVSSNSRGFVWTPVGMELLAIYDGQAGTLRYADTQIVSLLNPQESIRGKEIIPNLIKQMSAVRAQIVRRLHRDHGSSKEFGPSHEKVSDANIIDDPWKIKFVLETGEIGDNGDIFKQYRHTRSGRVVVVKLTPDGKLLLPKIPEEWGQLFVEPGA